MGHGFSDIECSVSQPVILRIICIELGKGHRRFFIFRAHELHPAQPIGGVNFTSMIWVEGTEFAKGAFCRFQIILHRTIHREHILIFRTHIGQHFGCRWRCGRFGWLLYRRNRYSRVIILCRTANAGITICGSVSQ